MSTQIIIPEIEIEEAVSAIIKFYYTDLKEKLSSYDPVDPADVDTGISITKLSDATETVGQAVRLDFTGIVAANLDGKAFKIARVTEGFYVWYNVDGNSEDPALLPSTSVEVTLVTGDSSSTIATKTKTALEAVGFTSTIFGGSVWDITTPVGENAEAQSLLYQMFNGVVFGKINFYSQLKNILIDKFETKKRPLGMSLGYSQNINQFPHISILLPSEEYIPQQSSFGEKNLVRRDEGTAQLVYSQFFQTTYLLLITSDNHTDVILLYHFVKSAVLSAIDQFSLRGISNLKITGRDVTMDMDLTPQQLFHRSIGLTFQYNNCVPSMIKEDVPTSVTFTGTPVA